MKKCRFCGDDFEPSHGNQAYCNPEHRKQMKHREVRSRIGTQTISKHRNPNFAKERKIISKHKMALTIKGHQKGMKWRDTGDSDGDYDYSSKQAGVQITHSNATVRDYYRNGIDYICYSGFRTCEDCGSSNIIRDRKRAEIVCRCCGLVQI